jgi:hypothetical protein
VENRTGLVRNAVCVGADPNYVAFKNQVNDWRSAFTVISGGTDEGRLTIAGIFIAIISMVSGFYIGWQIAIIDAVMIALSFAMIGWLGVLSLPAIALFVVIAVYLIYKMWSG